MPTYAPSWEQTSPSTPPVHMGGGGTLTHRENVGAGAHVLPAESGQQLMFFRELAIRTLAWTHSSSICL
jgi:hypothetical protein